MEPQKFQPFASALDVSFWSELSKKKLEELKLDSAALTVSAAYATSPHTTVPSRLQLSSSSLQSQPTATAQGLGSEHCWTLGQLYNSNTQEEFKKLDKPALAMQMAHKIWKCIRSGEALRKPELLNQFICLAFADLKSHRHMYWLCFPAVLPVLTEQGKSKQLFSVSSAAKPMPLSETLKAKEKVQAFVEAYRSWQGIGAEDADCTHAPPPAAFLVRCGDSAKRMSIGPLTEWNAWQSSLQPGEEVFLAFVDPAALPSHPGWPLRNLLLLAAVQWGVRSLRVLSLRDVGRLRSNTPAAELKLQSVVFSVELSALPAGLSDNTPLTVMGWERNQKEKLAPRTVDLRSLSDPETLAANAVYLNLQLMRWRMLPELDLPTLQNTKCLLLGSGTLGCNVARALLGWGITKITFVDSGKVSFSNPPRQSLFTFKDTLNGGRDKAEAAAERVKEIFPHAETRGVSLSIPMPGHLVTEQQALEVEKDVATLTQLYKEHDAIFLLTDSRESRWLPTLLGAALSKLTLNTALGFDSLLVQRHGVNHQEGKEQKAEDGLAEGGEGALQAKQRGQLGCYFCNDVVAPTDSLRDRTLDQQCTVTRPGLSFMAAGLVVELLVSILHHPQGPRAPADLPDDSPSSAFGIVPHQLRGFLPRFQTTLVVGQAFPQCTACSATVVREYRSKGWPFLLSALNNPQMLEDLCGLTKLKAEAEAGLDWALEEIDDEDF